MEQALSLEFKFAFFLVANQIRKKQANESEQGRDKVRQRHAYMAGEFFIVLIN